LSEGTIDLLIINNKIYKLVWKQKIIFLT
jgi:hypothetical protein